MLVWYSLYIVENANDKTVELFGNLIDPRYVRSRKRVTIGHDDEHGERLNHAHDMLWHFKIEHTVKGPSVGLYCVRT